MEEKKISSPDWGKISRGEYEEKRKQDLKQIEKAIPKKKPPKIGGVKQTPKEKERKAKKEIREHIRKMHKDALTKMFGLDKPAPEMCQACFQVLQGDVFVSNTGENLYLCRKCYQSLDRCANCSRPVKRSIKGVDKQYCEYCKAQKQCTSCSTEIKPKYAKRIENVPGFFCDECYEAEKCYYCGTPAVNNAKKIAGEALICEDCLKNAVVKAEQAVKVLKKVKMDLIENFNIRTSNPIKVGVATLDDINENGYENHYRVLKKGRGVFIIAALGVPLYELKGKIAHEVARDFISFRLGRLQPDEIYHGFGKYIRYHYLKNTGFIEEAHLLKKTGEYKEEFQHFMKLEKKLGFNRIIKTIKNGKMPLMV